MIRYITVAERKPQPGDVIQRGRYRCEVRHWLYGYGGWLHALVLDSRGLTRSIGPCPEGGWSQNGRGWQWWPAYRYVSRADGGSVTHPMDAGSWV